VTDDRAKHREPILRALRKQAETCAAMNAPICSELLARSADDLAAGGFMARLLDDWNGHPVLDNISMRLLGAVHYLALRGDAPALAACFPTTGGRYESARAWSALRSAFTEHEARVRARLGEPVQTNEVRRCCALLGGFIEIARAHPWPMRLLEIGASAGLNQCFEQYRYQLGTQSFGSADAPLALDCEWRGKPLDTDATSLRVASRKGCDIAPIDLRDPQQRIRLESFFWPDQPERLARLRAACQCALRAGVAIERANAGDWLAREIPRPAARETRVLFHSVMWLYVSEAERKRVQALMDEEGARATDESPLAWLRMEGPNFDYCEIRLRSWPGGEDRLLGRCHYHGAWVEWLAD
jgi:hypothetical protein